MLLCFGLKRDYIFNFSFIFFFSNLSLKFNGTLFLRNDDRRAVECVWNGFEQLLF